MKCPKCGSKTLRQAPVSVSRAVAGHVFSATVPALRCPACGEEQVPLKAVERFELLVAHMLGTLGASSGAVFKFQRKALGLQAAELGELLDASVETVSRWENGKRDIPRSALAVLATLVEDAAGMRTDTATKLRTLGKPRRIPKRVQLNFASGEAEPRAS